MFAPDQTARLDSSESARGGPPASQPPASHPPGSLMPVELEAWEPGKIVAERYHLQRRLGAGAMGEVFLAADDLLKKEVALKVLRAELAENRTIFKRFLREVALAHSVTHPNVVRIYDTGEAHGLPYLSMEYLRGQPLDELVANSEDEGAPPMTLEEIRETAEEILAGLQSAHVAGVIHRDLKPANVMLTRRGAIVMDFGVAGFGAIQTEPPDPNELDSLVRTEAGTIFGSPAYMAPELWDGAPANVQTDLYAFGVMLYQMLTGRLPYDAPNARVFLEKLKTTKPKPVRSIRRDAPWNLALLVERCMDHDPERRPRSAESAMRLVAPLSRVRRGVVIGAVGALGVFAASSFALRSGASEWEAQGLPDALALADIHAAVRHYDAGDYTPALGLLSRVEERAPQSASVHFWRALIWHELEDPDARASDCSDGRFSGSELWRQMARDACAPDFSLSASLRKRVDGRGDLPAAFIAIAVQHDLVPRLEAVHEAGPLLQQEARNAELALGSPPEWSMGEIALPMRWALASARLKVATRETDEAIEMVDHILSDQPKTPASVAYASWLFAQLGQRERAGALADTAFPRDPRPALRLALDEGRVRESAAHVDALEGKALHTSARLLWCGYAFRYEIARPPRRCRELPPGLVRSLWSGGAQEEDFTNMKPNARALIESQHGINLGRCLNRQPKAHTLTHVPPPFSTYERQLEVGAALCAHEPANAQRPLAVHLSQTLTAMDPGDPWANLIEAQVDLNTGRTALAASRRNLVTQLWAGADVDLPLVARLRENMGGPGTPPTPADDPELGPEGPVPPNAHDLPQAPTGAEQDPPDDE